MINLFRNIRKKLASENKFSAYSRYAIGEIVLVVIGILIALQINNWNEQRIEGKVLKEYLHKIADNVNQDIKQIEGLKIRRDTVNSKATRSGKALMKRDFSNIIDIIQGQYAFYEFYFTPNNSGFEALKNSSYLGKINNTKVDSLLTLYYSQVEDTHKAEASMNNFIENMEVQLNTNVDITSLEIILNDETMRFDKKNDLLPYIQHNAYKGAVFRTMDDRSYIRNYKNLLDFGNALIQEINRFCDSIN
jgi:hypothetical protein